MLILKLFANLLRALFTIQCPIYQQMYEIIKLFRGCSPNERSQIPHELKTIILWIILLKSRRFAQGNIFSYDACLRGFTNMENKIKAKKCGAIYHMEVPLELLQAPVTKWKEGAETISITVEVGTRDAGWGYQARKRQHIVHPYSTDLENLLKKPSKDAVNPFLEKYVKNASPPAISC